MQADIIPDGWSDTLLGAEMARVIGGGTPSRAVPGYWNGEIPWASVKDFNDDSKIIRDTQEHITAKGLEHSAANLIEPGTVLVCTRMAVGRAAICERHTAINQDVKALYPSANLDPHYLLLLLAYARPHLEAISIGSTVKGLNIDQLLGLRVKLPHPTEQRRIVEVLHAIDATIQSTEKLITKLRWMEAGLLHDLLTRGLDRDGKLRDPIRHPEQFKGSPLGFIPKEWEPITLGAIVLGGGGTIQTGPFGSQLHAHEYVLEGTPVVMPQDIHQGRISEVHIARVSSAKAAALWRHKFKVNDVVFARRGDLERCACIGEREEGWLCGTGCLLVRPPKNELSGDWLASTYRHERSQRQILARAVGSTMVNLNAGLLSTLLIAKPKLDEQTVIVERLAAQDKCIRAEEANRDKLIKIKKGLLHDLLTGCVRVPAPKSEVVMV